MKDKVRAIAAILFAILFVWLILEGDLLENRGGRSAGELLKEALPTLLPIAAVLLALIVLANFGSIGSAIFHLLALRTADPHEDERMTEYRRCVLVENFVGGLRAFCGSVGMLTLFILALLSLIRGTEGGLFSGGVLAVVRRLGEFGFFAACLWGLFRPWTDYLDENGKDCQGRKERLARIEQDPAWWHKVDEREQQRKNELEELKAKLDGTGYDPDYWKKALERSDESLASLTRQIRSAKTTTDKD